MAHRLATRALAMRSGAIALALAGLSAAPAMAGRCGHTYPVDEPTTLAKVARACNVSLAALKEANPGADPAYVTPGERLAVPDEMESATDVPAGGLNLDAPYEPGPAPIYRYVEYVEPGAPAASGGKIDQAADDAVSPYYVQASFGGALTPFRENETLSYQKRSAERIRNAGVIRPTPSLTIAPLRPRAERAVEISFPAAAGEPLSPLMECSVLRRREDGKVSQVREFKPVPEGREVPVHCAAVSASTAKTGAVFTRSAFMDLPPLDDVAVLRGYITEANAECITLQGERGETWRIHAARAPMQLLGKQATVWAEVTNEKACNGLVLDRVVYTERIQ